MQFGRPKFKIEQISSFDILLCRTSQSLLLWHTSRKPSNIFKESQVAHAVLLLVAKFKYFQPLCSPQKTSAFTAPSRMAIQCAQQISYFQASLNFSPVKCPSGCVPLKQETTNKDLCYSNGYREEFKKVDLSCSYPPAGTQVPMYDRTALNLLKYSLISEHIRS